MPRNDAAAPAHVCPGIRIHAIDIVQPPGIGIPPIADMDAHQTIVVAALAAKSSAETPKKARSEVCSDAMRREISRLPLAPTTPTTWLRPRRTRRGGGTKGTSEVTKSSHHRLVAPLGRAVEPLLHAPEGVQPERIGGIGVVD